MSRRGKAEINLARPFTSESRDLVTRVFPNATCICIIFSPKKREFQVLQDIETLATDRFIGFSTRSQRLAWENAWAVISKKMMKKLEM